MKNKFLNSFIIITLILVAFIVYNKFKLSQNSHFTVTADTVIKPGSEISKYVTQEEVDSFAFRYWDIDNNYTKFVNPIAIPLRDFLKQKDTNKVLNYIKDNNLSADIEIEDGTTPLMYSSFYNDTNTTKELIKLGADVHKKDKYKLNSMAYAISMGNIDIVKILFNSGVKFEEAPLTQGYILAPSYQNIDKLIIDGDNIKIIYKYNWIQKDYDTPKGGGYMFEHTIYENWTRLAKFILESGYKPYPYVFTGGDHMDYGNSIYDFISKESIDSQIEYQKQNNKDNFDLNLFMDKLSYDYTLYKGLEDIPNHEPMLNLLLEHNVSGQPSKELMKKAYDKCYNFYYKFYKRNWMDGDKINKKRPFYVSLPIKLVEKSCPNENGTFNNIKEFMSYKNKQELMNKIIDLSDIENKVILKNPTDTIYNEINTINGKKFRD